MYLEADAPDVPRLTGYIILTMIVMIACSVYLRRSFERDPEKLDLEARSRHYLLFYIPYFLIARLTLSPPEAAPPEFLIFYWLLMEEAYFFAQKNLDAEAPLLPFIDLVWGPTAIIVTLGIIQSGPFYGLIFSLATLFIILGLMILLPTRPQ